MDASRFALLILHAKRAASSIPATDDCRITLLLVPTSDPDAGGTTDFLVSGGRACFTVRVTNGPRASALDIDVGGLTRATVTTDDQGDGVAVFRTGPVSADALPLDFDPRGETIEIKDGAAVVLRSVDFATCSYRSGLTAAESSPHGGAAEELARPVRSTLAGDRAAISLYGPR